MLTFLLLQGEVLLRPLLPALVQFEEAMLFRLLPAEQWTQDSLQPPPACLSPASAKATQGRGEEAKAAQVREILRDFGGQQSQVTGEADPRE